MDTGIFMGEASHQGPPPPPAPRTQEPPLFCWIGVGWVLFILGFFFGIQWYVGAIILCCSKDRRERPGCTACLIFAIIWTIVVIIMVKKEEA